MKRKNSDPSSSLVIETYKQLDEYVQAFAKGSINLLILIGECGLAKSTTIRNAIGEDVCWIEGNARPFGIYMNLYRHRNELVVIDDVDEIYSEKAGIRLLKSLCQTQKEKSVSWHTAANALTREGIPREFRTSSRVAIISNDWKTLSRNVAALEDRGHILVFRPSSAEVHRKVAEWFQDVEIYDWVGGRLGQIRNHSMRLYYRAAELKSSGLDWRRAISGQFCSEVDAGSLVAELLRDQRFATQKQRVEEFVRRRGGCRATFFNHVRKLRDGRG